MKEEQTETVQDYDLNISVRVIVGSQQIIVHLSSDIWLIRKHLLVALQLTLIEALVL